jgi:nucleobase:cation symporter-1, NCS1 family
MDNLRSFYENHIVQRPDEGSFSAKGESARWSNRDLDPVPPSQKKWEWWHVGGFWVAEGFSVATMEVPSSAVALGLNPGVALGACLLGNLLVTIACCSSGYIGAKVRKEIAAGI